MSHPADEQLREAIVARLAAAPGLDASEIEVTTDGGYVVLAGHVGTETEQWEATNVTDHVEGVKDVANNLQLRGH
jgi:osmotically-inducible protein OsmY